MSFFVPDGSFVNGSESDRRNYHHCAEVLHYRDYSRHGKIVCSRLCWTTDRSFSVTMVLLLLLLLLMMMMMMISIQRVSFVINIVRVIGVDTLFTPFSLNCQFQYSLSATFPYLNHSYSNYILFLYNIQNLQQQQFATNLPSIGLISP